MDKHTSTPWRVKNGNDIVTDKEGTIACAYGMLVNNKVVYNEECLANAAFIVRAVNCHEDLLKVIHWLRSEIDENGQGKLPDGLCGAMDCAIAKAEGK